MSEQIRLENGDHVTLRQYIERVLDERQKALELLAGNLEHRLESLNALRNEVLTDRTRFVEKEVYSQMHSPLVERIEKLEKFQSKMIGIGAVLIVLAGLAGHFWK